MKLQRDSYSCGVYAIMNAAKCFGIDLKRRDITKYSKTSREKGTNEKGVIDALDGNGLHGEDFIFHKYERIEAYELLDEVLAGPGINPIILSVDDDNHWVTLIGKLGSKYIIYDSDGSKWNREENGVQLLTTSELEERWRSKKHTYYCIIVDQKIE